MEDFHDRNRPVVLLSRIVRTPRVDEANFDNAIEEEKEVSNGINFPMINTGSSEEARSDNSYSQDNIKMNEQDEEPTDKILIKSGEKSQSHKKDSSQLKILEKNEHPRAYFDSSINIKQIEASNLAMIK